MSITRSPQCVLLSISQKPQCVLGHGNTGEQAASGGGPARSGSDTGPARSESDTGQVRVRYGPGEVRVRYGPGEVRVRYGPGEVLDLGRDWLPRVTQGLLMCTKSHRIDSHSRTAHVHQESQDR